jgi:hypothetical protein
VPLILGDELVPSDYRFSQPLLVRVMGVFLVLLGVAVFLLAAVVGLFSLPLAVLSVGVVLAVAAIFVVGFLLTRKAWVVRLAEAGYQVRFVRGAGVKQARWKDVEDVVASTVAGEDCVVLRLRDGRTTTIPVRALATGADEFTRDLGRHLNTGHGYRPAR